MRGLGRIFLPLMNITPFLAFFCCYCPRSPRAIGHSPAAAGAGGVSGVSLPLLKKLRGSWMEGFALPLRSIPPRSDWKRPGGLPSSVAWSSYQDLLLPCHAIARHWRCPYLSLLPSTGGRLQASLELMAHKPPPPLCSCGFGWKVFQPQIPTWIHLFPSWRSVLFIEGLRRIRGSTSKAWPR